MAINDHSQFHAQYNRPLTHTTYVCLYNMSLMFMFLQKKLSLTQRLCHPEKVKTPYLIQESRTRLAKNCFLSLHYCK